MKSYYETKQACLYAFCWLTRFFKRASLHKIDTYHININDKESTRKSL